MISTEKKFVFIHIPKTGGNAIRLALKPYVVDSIVMNLKQQDYNDTRGQIHRFGISNPYIKMNKHSKLAEIHSRWDEKELGRWTDMLKFSVVRNPWDRLISCFFSPHLGRTEFDREEFKSFVKSVKLGTQSDFVTEDGHLATDRLIRFETLSEDFANVCSQLGIEQKLTRVNESKRRPYREYYDKELIDLVSRHYAEDVERFQYTF